MGEPLAYDRTPLSVESLAAEHGLSQRHEMMMTACNGFHYGSEAPTCYCSPCVFERAQTGDVVARVDLLERIVLREAERARGIAP
jgi:hypothetical protein